MVLRSANLTTGLILIIATLSVPLLDFAKAKNKPADPQDSIDVLANLPSTGGLVTRLTETQHYSRTYLYLEHATGGLTLVDITDARHPSVLGNLDVPGASVLAAAGDAALVSSDAPPAAPAKPRTMTIMNFADPAHPQTVRQFTNVTCTVTDNRGLIFVANPEGLWILHRNPAEDPQLQESYAHEVLYNH